MALRRIGYLAALAAATVFYIAYQQWLGWFALVLILALPWFSLALSIPAMVLFTAEPEGPERVPIGVDADLRLMGRCRLPVPPFRGKLRVERIPTGEQWVQKTSLVLPTDHCGGLKVSVDTVWVYDYLGLFRLRVKKIGTRRVLVYPRVLAMKKLPDLEKYLARSWRPKAGGGFAENHEMRLYRPGDSLNQIHWKLTAKTGKIIIREPMIPDRGLILLTMNLRGDAPTLDRKFGRLLWLGQYLLEQSIGFELRVLTGSGIRSWRVDHAQALTAAVDELLCQPPALEGDLRTREYRASWQHHIGGEPDED